MRNESLSSSHVILNIDILIFFRIDVNQFPGILFSNEDILTKLNPNFYDSSSVINLLDYKRISI